MAKLRVGIVGAGHVSDLHAKAYQNEPRAEIVAVCDPNEDAAIARSLAWGASHFYNNYDELLANPDIDAVEILTPNYLHAAMAIKALQAGKHVSVERPLALSFEDADRVIKAAATAKKVLHVFEPCLYYKPLLDAHHLISAGEIGTITGIRVDATLGHAEQEQWNFDQLPITDTWRFDPKQVGGSPMLYDVGYQAFCMSLFLVGTSIDRVEVWRSQTKVGERMLDAPTVAMWKHFQQEVYGQLSFNYAPERKMRSEFYPLEFSIKVAGTRGEIVIHRSADPTSIEPPVELRRHNRKVTYGQKSTTFEDSFIRAGQNFIGSCLGQEEPLLRGAEAKQLLVLTTAYFESARRGRAIPLQHG